MLPLPLPLPPPPRCHRRSACHATTATAKLLPSLPPTSLRCYTAATPSPLPRCRRLRRRTVAATATAVPMCCPPPLRFCRCQLAATANAALPSTTLLPSFSLSLLLLSLSWFPSLLPPLLLVDCCFFCPCHSCCCWCLCRHRGGAGWWQRLWQRCCRCQSTAAKLLLPLPPRCRQAACHCRHSRRRHTATKLPLLLPRCRSHCRGCAAAMLPPPRPRCRQAAATAAKLPASAKLLGVGVGVGVDVGVGVCVCSRPPVEGGYPLTRYQLQGEFTPPNACNVIPPSDTPSASPWGDVS
jgi:hypothetical protein